MPITESALTSGFVVGVLIRSLADSSDVGDLPDILPANVKPVFTRVQGQYRLALAATDSAGAHGALVQHEQVKTAIIQTGEHVGHITDDVDANGAALPDAVPGVRLVVGTYKVSFGGHFPDLNNVEVTSAHTQVAPLDLADLVGYTPLPGITVKTVALPTGGVSGQMLVLSGDELVWAEPVAGTPGPAGASVTGGVDNGNGTVSFTLSDGSTTAPVAVPPGPAGPKGDPGTPGPKGDTGATGPAPSLAIGTVTKLAAGATPTASFTGTNPYTLNLGLPPGADGSPTPYDKRGTGMPNGVVTGNPGDTYTDTAGTNGAWRWLKKTGTDNTGWEVIQGDTGWRDVPSWLSADWEVTSGLYMSVIRKDSLVTIEGRISRRTSGSNKAAIIGVIQGIPLGYRTRTQFSAVAPTRINTSSAAVAPSFSGLMISNGAATMYSSVPGATASAWAIGEVMTLSISYVTNDAWPTTLPGTAA